MLYFPRPLFLRANVTSIKLIRFSHPLARPHIGDIFSYWLRSASHDSLQKLILSKFLHIFLLCGKSQSCNTGLEFILSVNLPSVNQPVIQHPVAAIWFHNLLGKPLRILLYSFQSCRDLEIRLEKGN